MEALFEKEIPTLGEHKAAKGKLYHDVSRCYGVWQRPTVLRILNDERYTGTYIMEKRKVTEVGSTHTRLKEESEWFKVPDHHPTIVSRELFEQAHSKLRHFKSVKRNVNLYPLQSKVFCGCCRHAMPQTAAKNHMFICRYTKVDESFPCNSLKIQEVELESILYEVIFKQAQDITSAGGLTSGLVETLIDRVYIYLGNQLEIIWKIKDFCTEEV